MSKAIIETCLVWESVTSSSSRGGQRTGESKKIKANAFPLNSLSRQYLEIKIVLSDLFLHWEFISLSLC